MQNALGNALIDRLGGLGRKAFAPIMTGKLLLSVPISIFAVSLQAAGMIDAAELNCRVEGVQFLVSQASPDEVCDLFHRRLSGELPHRNDLESLSISLEISKSGSIDAYVRDASGAFVTPYPSVSVDVMDRALGLGDVERLAVAVAEAMTAQTQ